MVRLGRGGKLGDVVVSEGPAFVCVEVAEVDILLIGGCWVFGVFLVEFAYNIWGVFEVFGRVPGLVWVVETGPLNPILDLVPVSS